MRSKPILFLGLIAAGLLLCLILYTGGPILWSLVRPQPRPAQETIFKGVEYIREVQQSPRPLVVHVIRIDLRTPGLSFLVTPGDPDAEYPLEARTTSAFLDEFDLQVAVNGDGFEPWSSNSLFSYYPHSGDPVDPIGFAASNGRIYSEDTDDEPTLYISKTNRARFNQPPGKIHNAISGNQMIVVRGKAPQNLDDDSQPRTAIGLDKKMRTLIIAVVDGRQPGYSQGATLDELAGIMIDHGAYNAMNLDGGGSSTLVRQGLLNRPQVLNSPVDHSIPSRQRVVGNHLGIYVKPVD